MYSNVLLPLKFKVPSPDELRSSPEQFIAILASKNPDLAENVRDIAQMRNVGALRAESWAGFCTVLLHTLFSGNQANATKDGWTILRMAARDPVRAFNDLLLSTGESSYFPNIDRGFVSIVDEVLRDGVVTKAEADFLQEKATEYNVASKDVAYVLETKRRFNTALLSIVDEICRDGIITEVEQRFLEEKAAEYGELETNEVQKLIDRSLSIHTKKSELNSDQVFSTLVGSLFLFKYLLNERNLSERAFSIADQYIVSAFRGNLPSREGISLIAGHASNAVNQFLGFQYFDESIELTDLIRQIISIPDPPGICTTPEDEPSSEAIVQPATPNHPEGHIVLIDGLRFTVELIENDHYPLACHSITGNTVQIKINRSHPFLRQRGSSEIELAVKLGISLTLTKLQFYPDSNFVDEFFDQLTLNEKIVARKRTN